MEAGWQALVCQLMTASGTFRTWSDVRLESVVRTKADSPDYYRFMDSRRSQLDAARIEDYPVGGGSMPRPSANWPTGPST